MSDIPPELAEDIQQLTDEITEQEPSEGPSPLATDEVAGQGLADPAPAEVVSDASAEDPPAAELIAPAAEGELATPGEDAVARASKAEQAARSEDEVGGVDAAATTASADVVQIFRCPDCEWRNYDAVNGAAMLESHAAIH